MVRDAFEFVLAAVGEGEFAADDEVADRAGDEDLTGLGEAHDAGGEVDGEPGDVVVAPFDLAGMQSSPQVESELAGVADDLRGAAHALRGPGEESQRAVTGRLDRLAAVRLDRSAGGG